jgi:hypothetical protein
MDIVDRINAEKTLIFTVTPGRSGTKYLTALLGSVPGIAAHHEPMPDFVTAMRRGQQDPEIALAFLRDVKLPGIAAMPSPIYAETSHLFCKGFLEPAILLGLRPKLIVLRRPPSEVAWSLLERDTIPTRTPYGCLYLLDPRDPGVMPLPGWERMTDYQLCFWYALEIERRQLRYAAFAAQLGLACFEVLQRDLGRSDVFAAMLNTLGIAMNGAAASDHESISGVRHNSNRRSLPKPDDLPDQEAELWRAVLPYEPLLPSSIEAKYEDGASAPVAATAAA